MYMEESGLLGKKENSWALKGSHRHSKEVAFVLSVYGEIIKASTSSHSCWAIYSKISKSYGVKAMKS